MDEPLPPNLPPLPPALPYPPPPGPAGLAPVGRRRPVWPWVLGGALGLFGLLVLLGAVGFGVQRFGQQRQRSRAALQELERVQQQTLEEQRRALSESQDGVTGASERLARSGSALGDAARKVSGDDRKVLEAGQHLYVNLQPRLQTYEAAFGALRDAGLFEPKTLQSKEAIAARRDLLRALAAANEDLAAAYSGMVGAFRAELQAAGISALRAGVEVRSFEGAAHLPDQLQLREQDRQMTRAGDDLLDLLGREWGQWNVGADGRIVFRKQAALTRFQSASQRLVAAGQAQQQLQQRMMDRAAAPAPAASPR